MKTGLIFLILLFSLTVQAQSDYEKVELFKNRVTEIREDIKNVSSLQELNLLESKINALHDEFKRDTELLNKSLYPDNFESTLSKLEQSFNTRKADFTQITELSEEVTTLKSNLAQLTEENKTLIVEIEDLKATGRQNEATIRELSNLVAKLKKNIETRDKLVRSMIDSLLTDFVRSPTTLDEAEKQAMIGKIENRGLFYNIERVIADNISYIEVTEMQAPDVSEMKEEYNTFSKAWRQLGKNLATVYLSQREREQQIAVIDNLFREWNGKINSKIWQSINKLFVEQEIQMLPFQSGEQFFNSILTFIQTERDNLKLKESDEVEKTYDKFVYDVYLKSVQPVWLPLLIENKMFNQADQDSIESAMAQWKEAVFPAPDFTWLYIVLGILIVAQVVVYVIRKRSKLKNAEAVSVEGQDKENN